ncbi:MAG: hypothetical protein IKX40_01895 [Thermoguttaceae bacterium]|nr:hypothetical protein [Thermoguttaceae bacterium]
MNITNFSPRLADDLTVVVDGAETIQIYQPDSGSLLTISNCVSQPIKANKAPSESPQGATILEREWNVSLGSRQEAVGSSNSPSANSNSLATRNSQLATINDIIIDSRDRQWRIVSIERKERIGRVVYKAQQIDLSPRLDEWVDIITPIYQTDDNGAPFIYKYQLDLTGVSVRIIRVPVSSHRQLIDVPEERIEIVFADKDLRIGAHQRIRLADGTIYKPTDLFPITQTRPALRIIAQREAVGSSN